MSVRDLITGYLLGDDGGEIRYYDKTFHEIIDNTTYFLEKILDSTYKVKFGIWKQIGVFGNFASYTDINLERLAYGYTNESGSVKFNGYPNIRKFTCVPVYVFFKNGTAIYAKPVNWYPQNLTLSPEIMYERYNSGTYEKEYFYVSKGDYSIDNIEQVGNAQFVIKTSPISFLGNTYYLPNQLFEVGGLFRITYSYQKYKSISRNPNLPEIVSDGDRVTTTADISLMANANNTAIGTTYEQQNAVFSDLSNDDLYQEMLNVFNAEFTALGFDTYPVSFLTP